MISAEAGLGRPLEEIKQSSSLNLNRISLSQRPRSAAGVGVKPRIYRGTDRGGACEERQG